MSINISTAGDRVRVEFNVADVMDAFPGSPLEQSLIEGIGGTVEVENPDLLAEALAMALAAEDIRGGCKLDEIIDEALRVVIADYEGNGLRIKYLDSYEE